MIRRPVSFHLSPPDLCGLAISYRIWRDQCLLSERLQQNGSEVVHGPDGTLARRCSGYETPCFERCEHLWPIADDLHWHIPGCIFAADVGRRLVVAEHDQHEVLVRPVPDITRQHLKS